MGIVVRAVACLLVWFISTLGWAGEFSGQGDLKSVPLSQLPSMLPSDTLLLETPSAIERFLADLDDAPPDWSEVYGKGHHAPGLDDRLFELNRARDAKREGRPALSRRLSFLWSGELSAYREDRGGFPVALGPRFIKTSWGMVRFKPDDAPGNLSVSTDAERQEQFSRRLENGQSIEIDVVMTGRLIPQESILYDFSHDEAGLGLIMPFVRIEGVDFIMQP